MKTIQKSTLPRQLVVLTFLLIFVAGVFGLVTVGLRQQIAASGAKTRAMETRLAEIDRTVSKLRGEIAIALSPGQLEAKNRDFQLGLRPARESQIVRVDAETQIWFAARRWEQMVARSGETVGFYAPQNH